MPTYTKDAFLNMSVDEIDALVHDVKGREATDINNEGLESQFEFLKSMGLVEGLPLSKDSEATEERQLQYLENGGTSCLFCDDSGINVEGDDVEIDSGTATQNVGCMNCGGAWRNCYTLTHVMDSKGPRKFGWRVVVGKIACDDL